MIAKLEKTKYWITKTRTLSFLLVATDCFVVCDCDILILVIFTRPQGKGTPLKITSPKHMLWVLKKTSLNKTVILITQINVKNDG